MDAPNLRMIAALGIQSMVTRPPAEWLPVVPSIVPHIREALNTQDPQTVANALNVLQSMLQAAPPPYGFCDKLLEIDAFKRMLPIPNKMRRGKISKTKVVIGYVPKAKNMELRDVIDGVLETMVSHGGEEGLRLMKSYVPEANFFG